MNKILFKIYLVIVLCSVCEESFAQIPNGVLHRQISRASRFEFALYNSGLLYGDFFELGVQYNYPRGFAPSIASWPRGNDHMGSGLSLPFRGIGFIAKKGNEYYFREASSIGDAEIYEYDIPQGVFYGMVPGRIGDPNAGYDEKYNGAGWKYVDDRDYIVYSSLNYDSNGVDISGNNYNDWPIRYLNGYPKYVPNYLDRPQYKPVYKSDEDFFTVYKDTDTRAYRVFQKSRPLELEVHQYVYTWGTKGLKDVLVFQFEYINKSNDQLDSCYFIWDHAVQYSMPSRIPEFLRAIIITTSHFVPEHDLIYQQPKDTTFFTTAISYYPYFNWVATKKPPVVATSILNAPFQYNGVKGKAKDGGLSDQFINQYVLHRPGGTDVIVGVFNDTIVTEEIIYRRLLQNKVIRLSKFERWETPILLTTPFKVMSGDTARFVASLIFAEDTTAMFRLNDIVKRVYESGFKTPSPPDPPVVKAKALNRGSYLEWDKTAESSIDPIIPDTLSKAFAGYRVYRSARKEGPYKLLKQWQGDTLAHDYFDKGEDIGGLKNNVTYYYKVASFDQGDTLINLESMESSAIEGRNSIAITPSTASSNITTPVTPGTEANGSLGDIGTITLTPTNATNYKTFFEGKNLQINLTSITNGVKYLFPVTIKDTLFGKVHNDIIDVNLNVHGTNETKGIKSGKAIVNDIFGLNGANLEVQYIFEQLPDSFTVKGTIQSTNGADVPIITKDSLKYSGITDYSPYASSPKNISLRFIGSGVDTVSTLFKRYIPYLTVELYDETTGMKIDTGYTFTPYGVRATTLYTGKLNRYYLSGTLSNGETWEFGHVLRHYNSRVVFDYSDRGFGSGKAGSALFWGSVHRSGTKDFTIGDRANITWSGGVKVNFPKDAVLTLTSKQTFTSTVTDQMMEKIRIVPNPYLVRHIAQRGTPELYFNYLPEECTIRIYTIALDLVKTIHHKGGSRTQWDLQTEGGQIVASQLLYAYIESTNGAKTIKKFSVIVGK